MASRSHQPKGIYAGSIIGADVLDQTGQKVGKVRDLVLDPRSGGVMFATIGFVGFLYPFELLHPVPWISLQYDGRKGHVVMHMRRHALKEAPYDTKERLLSGSHAYALKAHAFYDRAVAEDLNRARRRRGG